MTVYKDARLTMIADLLVNEGFSKKGKAFFRIQGDGVFQFVKWEKTWAGGAPELLIGIQSLYSEMDPTWFSPRGCIAKYSIALFNGEKSIDRPGSHKCGHDTMTDEEQTGILFQKAIPKLNETMSQKNLIDLICELEMVEHGMMMINWRDDFKIAPYMAIREYDNATKVMKTILTRCEMNHEINRRNYESEGKIYVIPDSDKEYYAQLHKLLAMVESKDDIAIHAYLQGNYDRNIVYAKGCIARKRIVAIDDPLYDACPSYVGGSEVWNNGILQRISDECAKDWSYTKKLNYMRKRIREEFGLDGNKYPHWCGNPDWPFHNGKPMHYVKTTVAGEKEYLLHHFIDPDTGTERIIDDHG